jgi:signal transduction histidine kinase
MAAARAASVASSRGSSIPSRARVYYWTVSLLGIVAFIAHALQRNSAVSEDLIDLIPWTIALLVLHLLPVAGGLSAHLAVDQSVCTAAAMVLSPLEVALVGLVSSFDMREVRGEIPLTKAVFNRVQTATSYFAGSLAVHALTERPESSPYVIPLALVVLSTQTLTNYLLVGTAISIEHTRSLSLVIRTLRVGTPTDFLLAFLAGGILGAMLAAMYDQVHPLTLLAFVGPILLARQALERSQRFVDTFRAYRAREHALVTMTEHIREERSDERRLIAADLHDEVLQPLFKVSLMAHVLKADLATGRLLAMDEDLPQLVGAAELASSSLRDLIGDLRKSALGRGGLSPAILNLVRGFRKQTPAEIQTDVDAVSADEASELILYQIAKEALTNAVSHSKATKILVTLRQDSNGLYLGVRDNGIGFDSLIAREGHYGLEIMGERTRTLGGCLTVDTVAGKGCNVTIFIPAEVGEKQG